MRLRETGQPAGRTHREGGDEDSEPRLDEATQKPKLRADAARNRERILEAAEDLFASRGASVPIDDIAREAGVGVGTLYRHFPTKEDMFEAILVQRLQELIDSTAGLIEAPNSCDGLFTFLDRVTTKAQEKQDVVEAFEEAGWDFKQDCAQMYDCLQATAAALLAKAQNDGLVRKDIDHVELLALAMSPCNLKKGGARPQARERMLKVLKAGLRA